MHFTAPGAAAAGLLLVVLLLLGYLRRRARSVTVPSLRLWRSIPERLPPVEKRRAPRVTLVMILQVAAAAMLVLTLMGPFVLREAPAPLRLVVGIDVSARMAAGSRFEQARQLVLRWIEQLEPDDAVELHTTERVEVRASEAGAALRRLAPASKAVPVGPLAARLAAVRGREDEQVLRYLITDHLAAVPDGVERVVVGSLVPNAGIVDVSVADDRLAVTVQAQSVARVEIDTGIDHLSETFEGERTVFLSLPPGDRFTITVSPTDAFPLDNRVEMEREPKSIEVTYEGRVIPVLVKALQSDPRVRLAPGGVRVRVGEIIEVFQGDFGVPEVGDPRRPGRLDLEAEHPILKDVRAEELLTPSAREVRGGRWLIRDGGRVVCAVEGRRVLCGLGVTDSEWKRTASFPIFWRNVLTHVAGETTGGRWRPAPGSLLDRKQSWIPDAPATLGSALDTLPGTRKLHLDEAFLALAAILMIVAWWAERKIT